MSDRVPRVSVLMPVFNGLPYLPEALESILTQTYADFELVVVDDGSHDGSSDLLRRLADREPRVRVVDQQHAGLVAALTQSHRHSRGQYLARMDADDLSYSQRLEQQVQLLDRHDDVAVVSCAADLLDEDGQRTGQWIPELHNDMLLELAAGNPIVHGSVMMRRDAFEAAGGYRQPPEDYDLWVRLARQGAGFAVAQGEGANPALYGFRTHADRYSLVRKREQSEAIVNLQLPLLGQATEQYVSTDAAEVDASVLAKLIEGWGRLGGAAWLCGRDDLARRALHQVRHLFNIRPRPTAQITAAFNTAADAMVWSGAPKGLAMKLRLQQLRLQPDSFARWRDLAFSLVKQPHQIAGG